MYQIISMTGEILAETDSPIFTKFNQKSGAWIPANETDAECVIVNGKRCIIYGKPFAANVDKVAFIKKIDSAKKFQKLEQNAIKISDDNLDIIEVVVELNQKIIELEKRLEGAENG